MSEGELGTAEQKPKRRVLKIKEKTVESRRGETQREKESEERKEEREARAFEG